MKQPGTAIWLLLDSRLAGGIESHVLQLAEGLQAYGEHVQVVFLTDYGHHPTVEQLRQRQITTIKLDGRFSSLEKTVRCTRPTLIHTHGYKAGIYGRLAALFNGVPVISTYHAGETPKGKLAFYDWLDRQSARLCNRVYAVSRQIEKRLPVAADIMDNFINTRDLPLCNGLKIAFAGRLSYEKGADYFLELARRLPKQDFHIYGDGPDAASLKVLAPDNVCFHGHQKEMSRVWPAIGLLIMPSRHEGLPMAALEAMGRGIPVVASRVGALDQLVDTNENGWLVETGDLPTFTTLIQKWLELPESAKQNFKHAARNKVAQRFSSDVAIPRLVSEYRQISRFSHVATQNRNLHR